MIFVLAKKNIIIILFFTREIFKMTVALKNKIKRLCSFIPDKSQPKLFLSYSPGELQICEGFLKVTGYMVVNCN